MINSKKNNLLIVIFLVFYIYSCNIEDSVTNQHESNLNLISEIDLRISEPSGLSLGKDNATLWTVSDNSNRVYNISLNGQLIKELKYEGNDLEGIVYNSVDNTLWLAEEQLREIVQIDMNGNELDRQEIDLPGSGNSGFEGVCLDSLQGKYLLNEKIPQLWASLASDFTVSQQIEINEMEDLSGITYDKSRDLFWIVSDQTRVLFLWSPSQGIVKSFDLPFAKAEGVAVNPQLNLIYIVSDQTQKLYIYDISDVDY